MAEPQGPRFQVDEGEIVDTVTRQVIPIERFNKLSTDAEKADIEQQLQAGGFMADADPTEESPAPPPAAPPAGGEAVSSEEAQAPDVKQAWLERARAANPNVPDDALLAYYDKKKAPVSDKLPTLDSWLPRAKQKNPEASDADLKAYWQEKYGSRGAKAEESKMGSFARGAVTAAKQLPQLGAGLIAGAGATIESIAGEGGVGTAIKEYGAKKYQEKGQDIAELSKPTDSFTTSFDLAKNGDYGALAEWMKYGLGYAGAQAVEMLATGGLGYVGGKVALEQVAKGVAEKLVAKEAARIAETEAGKTLAADVLRKQAVSNVAGSIGQKVALAGTAVGMEGGEIFGDVASESAKEGRALSGEELAKAFGSTLAAGGLEFVGDKFGFDLMVGKSPVGKLAAGMPGVKGRAARGVIQGAVAAPVEGATELLQTLTEEYGKGKDPLSDASMREAIDAAALGAVGGAAIGGVSGTVLPAQPTLDQKPTDDSRPVDESISQIFNPGVGLDEAIATAFRLADTPTARGKEAAQKIAADAAIAAGLRLPTQLEAAGRADQAPAPGQPTPILEGAPSAEEPTIAVPTTLTPRGERQLTPEEVIAQERAKVAVNGRPVSPADPEPSAPGFTSGPLQSAADLAYPESERSSLPTQERIAERGGVQKRVGTDIPILSTSGKSVSSGIEVVSPPKPKDRPADPREVLAQERQGVVEKNQERQATMDRAVDLAKTAQGGTDWAALVGVKKSAVAPPVPSGQPIPSAMDRAYPSVSAIKDLAQSKGFDLNSPVFKETLKLLTKKTDLDRMTPGERQRVADKLKALERKSIASIPPSKQPTAQKPAEIPAVIEQTETAPVSDIEAAQKPRSALVPEQNAEMLARAEKAKADLESGAETSSSILDFLRSRGGVQDQGSELSGMDLDKGLKPFQRKLINPKGLTLDEAAEAADEAGLIQGRDINALLTAIDREVRGGGSDWYQEATTGPGALSRERVEAAVEKILADKGRDIGKDVERIKGLLLGDPDFMGSPYAPKSERDWQRLIEQATGQAEDQASTEQEPADLGSSVDAEAHQASTSPENDTPEPTQAQKEAGNYKKGHIRIAGMEISIENPAGSERSGVDPNGKAWTQTLTAHYGYILGTKGKDKDHLDIFIKVGTPSDYTGPVFVVDQNSPKTNRFDEHKVVLGVANEAEAKALYLENYAADWTGFRSIKTFPSVEAFKGWLQTGDMQKPAGVKKPVSVTEKREAEKTRAILPQEHSRKVYLDVPFEKKEWVKQHSGKWDAEHKVWYALVDPKTGQINPGLRHFIPEPGRVIRDKNALTADALNATIETGKQHEVVQHPTIEGGWTVAPTQEPVATQARAEKATEQPDAETPFSLTAQEVKTPKAKVEDKQTSLDIPPATSGTRPIIGREAQPEEAPLFSKAAQEQEAEQASLPEAAGLLSPGDAISGEVWRSDSGYQHNRTDKASDVIAYEAEENGNSEVAEAASKSGIDLTKRAARDIVWVTRKRADATRYGTPEKMNLPEGTRVIVPDDGDGGMLVLLPEAQHASLQSKVSPPPSPTEILANALRGAADQIEGKTASTIQDVGEKIGGARKDLAEKTGSTGKLKKAADSAPAWRRRYIATEIVASSQPWKIGKWALHDTKQEDFMGRPRQVGEKFYDTKEEAEAAIPLAAVARTHRVYKMRDGGKYEIYRKIGDKKIVKVVDQAFDSDEDAMRYMATHAEEIIETKTNFGEEILPRPETVRRIGEDRRNGRDVTAADLKETFSFRGVEFGNWQNQVERQEVMNHAYDGLLDLAEALNIPAKAIGLNGELALAFGSRGHGLTGAAAHYERDYGVINLTKMEGAGHLAHEWFHATDHYFGRQEGKAERGRIQNSRGDQVFDASLVPGNDYVSHGFLKKDSQVRPEVRQAYDALIETMFSRAEQYVEDTQKVERFVGEAKNDVAKALDDIRNGQYGGLSRQLEERYYKRNNKPASAEQLAEFDGLAAKILAGEFLETSYKLTDPKSTSRKRMMSGRWTNDALEKLSAINKAVRGRSGFGSGDVRGPFDTLRGYMNRYSERLKMLADAQKGTEKTKRIPTEYAREAKSIDQGRIESYWATPHEMAARAFSAYVEDKLKAQGKVNDFIVYGTNVAVPTPWGWKRPFPTGEERKAIDGAFDALFNVIKTKDTDQGTAIYESTQDYGEPLTPSQEALQNAPYEVREGEQRQLNFDLAKAALGDLDRAAQTVSSRTGALPRAGIPARTIAHSFSADLVRDGAIDLTGHQINTAEDLARLAQVYRNPRFETFRILYTKNGKILGHEGFTSRLPGLVIVFKNGPDAAAKLRSMQERMDALGATGYYMLHNHPSGNSRPSQEDYRVTEKFAMNLPGFKGHVVIDSNEYTEINFNDDDDLVGIRNDLDLGPDLLLTPSIPSPLLSAPLKDADQVAELGKAIQAPQGYASVIYRGGSDGKVRGIQEVAIGFLSDKTQAADYLREQMVAFGAAQTMVHYSLNETGDNPGARELLAAMDYLIEEGLVLDYVVSGGSGGRPLGRNGVGVTRNPDRYMGMDTKELPSDRVMEQQSAYGETGRLEPENLRGRQTDLPVDEVPPTYTLPEITPLDNVIRTMQDKNIDLVRLVDTIKQSRGQVADELNPVLKEEMYMGRTAQRTQDFLTDELRPLIDAMRLNKVTLDEMDTYLHARHAQEANAYLKEINPDREDNEALSGMTDAEAQAILNAADRSKMDRLAARVDAILAKTRTLMVDYGLEAPETVAAWAEKYSFYVPLHRDGFEERMGTGQGKNIRGSSVRTRTGSTRDVKNILAHIALDREKTVVRGEKMRPVIALAGLIAQNPNSEIATLAKPMRLTYTDPATGLLTVTPGDVGGYRVPTIKTIGKDGTVEYRPDPLYKGRENVVNYRLAGVDHAIIFNEQNPRALHMAQALKDLDVGQLNTIMQAVAPVTRYLASINTQYNPVFGVVNFVRDVQFAMLALNSTPLANKKMDVLKYTKRAISGIYQDARAVRRGEHPTSPVAALWERFQHVGGPTGYRDLFRTSDDRAKAIERMLDPDWWQKTTAGKILTANGYLAGTESALINKIGKPLFEWLSDYNQTMENAVRLGVFQAGIENGMSDEQAASHAKNITVNFNKKGQIAAQMGALFAFFNASVQGTARLAETLFEKGQLTQVGKKILAGGVTLGVIQAVGMALAGFGDDDPPEFVRSKSIVIPVPGTEKGYVAIPMPLGFNMIPTVGRLMAEALIYGKPGEKGYQMLSAMIDTFSPVGGAATPLQLIAPTVVDPIVALSENKDWTGRKIYREDFDPRRPTPGFQRAKDSSTPWARGLAEAINYATMGSDYAPGKFSPTPDAIDYLITQATGGVGRELSKTAQVASGLVTGEEIPLYKVPLAGRFAGSSSGASSVRDAFYRNVERLHLHDAELTGRRTHREDVVGYLKENPEARLADTADRVEREVSKMMKQKREMVRRGERERVKLIDMQIQARMARFNEMVEARQTQ